MLNMKEMEQLNQYLGGAVHMEVTEKRDCKEVIIEYKNGRKAIAQFKNNSFNINPYTKFSSVQNYVARGVDGDNRYRGNCCGKIIEQFINYSYTKNKKAIRFADPMVGGGTSRDVCNRLGIKDAWFGDLNQGFNVMTDSIPMVANTIWVHPPYFVAKDEKTGKKSAMPQYSGVQWGNKEDISGHDGSHLHSFDKFIKWLNEMQYRLFEQLEKGGFLGILIGSTRFQGRYYDPLNSMNIFGKLESVVIKKQNNTMSENTQYSNSSYIPLEHEYLIIVRKEDNLMIPVTAKKEVAFDMRKGTFPTWRGLIQNLIENMGGQATLDQLEGICKVHPKAENNKHIREKLRQVLNTNSNVFIKVKEGVYQINKGQEGIQSRFVIA